MKFEIISITDGRVYTTYFDANEKDAEKFLDYYIKVNLRGTRNRDEFQICKKEVNHDRH